MANFTKNEELMSVFSERLTELLKRTKTSNAEIEHAMDISQATFQNVIARRTTPSIDFVMKCADFFGVSVDYLLGRCDVEGRQGDYDFEEIRMISYEDYLRHKKKRSVLDKFLCESYESPWPYNLAEEIIGGPFPNVMTRDQKEGLRMASAHLSDREQEFIWLYYKCGYTLEEIGKKYSITRSWVQSIMSRAIRKMKHPSISEMVRYGYSGSMLMNENERLEKEIKEIEERNKALRERIEDNKKSADSLSGELEEQVGCPIVDCPSLDISVHTLDLSIRAHNCLLRSGCETIGDIVKLIRKDEHGLDKIRNCGKRTKQEILDRLRSFGIDISDAANNAENRKELA